MVILLKFILRQRNLNETYTGGVGSYLLLNMTYAYVQYLRKNKEEEKIYNLGRLFLGFLKFYGEEFNHKDLGISIHNGGEFFKKWQRNYQVGVDLLCFENYQEPDKDLGRGSYQYPKVVQLFKEILHTLYKVKSSSESYLASIINVTSEMRKHNSSGNYRGRNYKSFSNNVTNINKISIKN
jgi:non-canonical poly(A) RNA polymerase PAPD5/7